MLSPLHHRRRGRSASFGQAAKTVALLATASQVQSFAISSTSHHGSLSHSTHRQRPRSNTISEGCTGTTSFKSSSTSSVGYRNGDILESGNNCAANFPNSHNRNQVGFGLGHSCTGTETCFSSMKSGFIFPNPPISAAEGLEQRLLSSTTIDATKNTLPPWLDRISAESALHHLEALGVSMRSYLTNEESNRVLSAIRTAARGDQCKVAGAAKLCNILADTMEMAVDSLIAAAFHYSSCVAAREQDASCEISSVASPVSEDSYFIELRETFGSEAAKIAKAAANLKRVERVAGTVVGLDSSTERSKKDRAPMDRGEADNLRSMLFSVTGDWRALAIRSAACLFRLRGLEEARRDLGISGLSPVGVYTSREALYLFSPLAHRLGMYRLKNELDSIAFRTLYKKQHAAVVGLAQLDGYQKKTIVKPNPSMVWSQRRRENPSASDDYGAMSHAMTHVLDDITRQVKMLLQDDLIFMNSIASVSVSARVKEPFSLWQKMLKLRARRLTQLRDESKEHELCGETPITIMDVPDAVALRVVLSSRKMSPDENDEVTRARDRALCYYAQNLITKTWPNSKEEKSKDYIVKPKPNGYQSLHYTTKARWHCQDWMFEIQVRSAEMHRVAEYGVAAHFDYKTLRGGSHLDHSSDAYLKSVQQWREKMDERMEPPSHDNSQDIPKSYEEILCEARLKARKEEIAPYIEAFSKSQTAMAREAVFVFVAPKNKQEGRILCLPNGARIVDALHASEKVSEKYGRWRNEKSHDGIFYNGSVSSITQKLNNGDVLVVPTYES